MWRISFVCTLFIIIFFSIIGRLFYWQVISGYHLKAEANAQYALQMTIPAVRGNIVTSDGYPLAMNADASLVYAEPKNIQNLPLFIKGISSILETPEASLSAVLSQQERDWIPIQHKVDGEKVAALSALSLQGLGFEKEPKRYYPEASMAANLLGFVGLDQNGTDKGYFGLEGFYNRELQGKPGSTKLEKDVNGAPILVGDSVEVQPQNGSTLTLWIDRTIQQIVETRLAEGIQKYGAKEGSVVIMDPKTGGILAMASYPSYDPATYDLFDKSGYKNSIVADSYEPGSTFKALVMAKGIDEGVIKADTLMDETGPVQVDGYSIKTWDDKYHGSITMTQVLENSSNVGMVYVEQKLGKEKMLQLLHDAGVGVLTNIDLQDEATPDLRADSDWKTIDLATASFGQGIALTSIQLVRAVGALANNGTLMEPHVVKQITNSDGKTVTIAPKKIKSIFKPITAQIMTDMMVSAVDNGEAKWTKLKGYRMAGKTGTAQIPVAGHYDPTKTIASFVGFGPAENPRFVMLVILREPQSSQWGSETAAPLFFNIAKDILFYMGVPASQ